jgi:hypothetical protein
MTPQPTTIMTRTGEVFQPIRLYYHVHDMTMVHRIFGKMSCMDFDEVNDRWAWLYDGEARQLKFRSNCSTHPRDRKHLIQNNFPKRHAAVQRQYLARGSSWHKY